MGITSGLFGLEEGRQTANETGNLSLAVGVGVLTAGVELGSFVIQGKIPMLNRIEFDTWKTQ